MKKLFPQYYSEDITQPDWNSAIFAFDANVLLNLYGFSKQTTDGLIDGLDTIREQIFLPYQAALEYHRRLERKREQILSEAATPLLSTFDQIRKSFADELPKMNPLRDLKAFSESREFFLGAVKKYEPDTKSQIDEWRKVFVLHCTEIKEKLANVFENERIGTAPSNERVLEWCEQGKIRFAQNIPPGFKDKGKEEGNPYGDLFIWYELMDLATTRKKNVVFVTFEKKADWYDKDDGKPMTRRELRYEFFSATGQTFDAITADRFLGWLERIRGKVSQLAKEEVDNAVAQAEIKQLSAQDLQELLRQNLFETMINLTPQERDVLGLRFGLQDQRQRTREHVGKLLGVHPDDISKIELSALRHLRMPNGILLKKDEGEIAEGGEND